MSEVDEIIKDFEFLDSWEDKYQMIIDMGKSLPDLDEIYMNENYKLKGCQSTVYFVSKLNKDKTLSFQANSDAFIVKGLLGLVMAAYNAKTPREILDFDIEAYFDELALIKHLSPTRGNGIKAMVEKILSIAKQS